MTEKRRIRVLVLDDDRVASDVIVRTLLARGVDVSVVANPEKGIEKAVEERPDLVFVSLFFPDSNGLKVSKRIHAVEGLSKVPLVMLISYKGELDPKYTSTIGIVDVLVKPLDPEDVLEKTGRILGRDVLTDEQRAAEMPAEEGQNLPPARETPVADDLRGPFSAVEEAEEPRSDEVPSESLMETAGDRWNRGEETAEFPAEESGEETAASAAEMSPEEELAQRLAGESAASGTPFLFEDEVAVREETKKFFAGRRLAVIVAVLAAIVLGIGAFGLYKVLSKTDKTAQSREESSNREVVTEPPGGAVVADEGGGGSAAKAPEAKVHAVPGPVEEKKASPAGKGGTADVVPPKRPEVSVKKPASPVVGKEYGFSVQVGAFGSERNASSLAGKLKTKGYDAFVEETGGIWRVLVGRFETSKQAQAQEKALREDGFKTLLKRGAG